MEGEFVSGMSVIMIASVFETSITGFMFISVMVLLLSARKEVFVPEVTKLGAKHFSVLKSPTERVTVIDVE